MMQEDGRGTLRVGLRYDVSTFWCHHDTLTQWASRRIVDGFQEAAGDTSSTLNARSVIIVAVVVCRAVLDPVA